MSDEHGLDEAIAAYTKVWDSWHEPIDAKNVETVRKASLRAALSSKAEEVERLATQVIAADERATRYEGRVEAAESSLSRMKEALEPFIPSYEKWMDDHADDAQLHLYRYGQTFGDLRRAHTALGELQSNQKNPNEQK